MLILPKGKEVDIWLRDVKVAKAVARKAKQ
jgi:hypothetical protein